MKEWRQWLIIGGVFTAAAALLFFDTSDTQIEELRTAIQSQLLANRAMRKELSELRSQIYNISHGDRYLEQLTRNKLALSRKGEEVFMFQE